MDAFEFLHNKLDGIKAQPNSQINIENQQKLVFVKCLSWLIWFI